MSVFFEPLLVSKTSIPDTATGDRFSCTLGMDTSIRVSHELTESSVSSPQSVVEEPYTIVDPYVTTTYVSTTRLYNQHIGSYPIAITERVPIDSVDDFDIKVFLKEPKRLAESEEGEEVDLGREDGFKVKWGGDLEDTENGQKGGMFVWYGAIPPGKEVVLVSEWDVRETIRNWWD